jgi:hypothetical protein
MVCPNPGSNRKPGYRQRGFLQDFKTAFLAEEIYVFTLRAM